MKYIAAVLILLGAIALARADQTIEGVQQTLKDQGFYYGEITGQKDADTTAAIRRYQIRHGLQITGEINDETLRSLRSEPATPAPRPAITPAPSTAPETSELRDNSSDQSPDTTPAPAQPPHVASPEDRQSAQENPGGAPEVQSGLFAGTPFANATPDEQRNIVASAQDELANHGLYRDQIDGIFGPKLEFSLRAYQSRVGLPVTGRLDLETLAALELLPGAHTPVYTPRRPVRVRPDREPPVRGEWVHP
jgi:peptidoglycan hydrolase-like protein with peptidoglycan-binding domain